MVHNYSSIRHTGPGMSQFIMLLGAQTVNGHLILPKQYLCEGVKIVPPYRPGMATRIFAVGILHSHLIEFLKHDLAVVMGDIFLASHRNPKALYITVYRIHVVLHEFILRIGKVRLIRLPS